MTERRRAYISGATRCFRQPLGTPEPAARQRIDALNAVFETVPAPGPPDPRDRCGSFLTASYVLRTGKQCRECGNFTVIVKDGCDFCTACGAIGACG